MKSAKQRNKSERQLFRDLRENDPLISEAFENIHTHGETIKDQFTPELIKRLQSPELALSYREIARLLNVGYGSVAVPMSSYNKIEADDLFFEEYDYTDAVASSFAEPFSVSNLTIEEQVFLVISDTQVGSYITAEGLDRDPENTIYRYFERLKTGLKKAIHNRKIAIENFNIMFLGDLVDGWDIYSNQLTLPVREQMKIMVRCVMQLITFISETISPKNINVYSVLGNHGRVSRNHAKGDNWDVMLMDRVDETVKILRDVDERFATVNSFISEKRVQLHQIGRWNYLMTHGDQLKPTFISIAQKSSGWWRVYGHHDALLLGHWHQFKWFSLDGIQVVMGGCTYESPFVQEELAGKEDLVQILFGASESSPVAWVELIDVKVTD